MSAEDIKKLLGGYATGTLTEAEQQALFAAALEDQELFDALANEQALRDLLSDPSARATLLTSLDTPASRLGSFWQWLRRPAAIGLATASVVAIAVVAVWQGTGFRGVKPAQPQIVAELRTQAPGPVPPAEIPSQDVQTELRKQLKVETRARPRMADEKAKAVIAQAPVAAPPAAGIQAFSPRKEESDATAPAAAPPPPSAAPVAPPALARKKEAVEVTASAPVAAQIAGAAPENFGLDARALFYANQVAQTGNSFRPLTAQKDAAPRAETAAAGLLKSMSATAPRLGLRINILRSSGEADLTTVLDPGETVRLKVIPNSDGYLYVVEGGLVIAGGTVQSFKPFETTPLRFQGSGQDSLYVVYSRRPLNVAPRTLETVARGNLVQTLAEQERATYFVAGPGDTATAQVIVPVTLTFR
jgi:hypothetical protein